jgi:hypothetical protein
MEKITIIYKEKILCIRVHGRKRLDPGHVLDFRLSLGLRLGQG